MARAKSVRPDPDPVSAPEPAEKTATDNSAAAALPTAAVATRLAEACTGSKARTLLFVAADERRADEIGRALPLIAPDLAVIVLPPWDCLPYDRVSPSRGCMGRRNAALGALAKEDDRRRVLITSPDGLVQKAALPPAGFDLRKGKPLDRDALQTFAERHGFVDDERVDEPGEIAVRGQTIDLWPADATAPVRIDLDEEGTIVDLRRFDPASQRTDEAIDAFHLVPASEVVLDDDVTRTAGIEHRLPAYATVAPLFELAPDAPLIVEAGSLDACRRAAGRIGDAHQTRLAFAGPEDGAVTPPDHLYLVGEALDAALDRADGLPLRADGIETVPNFALENEATRAFVGHVRSVLAKGHRVVVTGTAEELSPLRRALKRGRLSIREAADWADAVTAAMADDADENPVHAEIVALLQADFEQGFADGDSKLTVVAASNVFGARAAETGDTAAAVLAQPSPQPGDVVVHEDHGVAVLTGLERVEVDGGSHDVLRLAFRDDDVLLAPSDELDRIWRYGSAPDAVTLDRLDGDGWNKRRVKVNAAVEEAAARLVDLARERAEEETAPIKPPKADYARFAARFPFPETGDQAAAIAAVLDDLASGRRMNRLVCGDVGYGKTEVALRAAAAVVLSGRQVALVAPTTVLARQHTQSFERRFAGTDVAIVHLSRLASSKEIEAAKKRLAAGKAGIVIGTQMVTSDQVSFADLALVIVDEEHRFGTKAKQTLQALAPHHLALSATPIPRTLQGALVGVQDVSVLAAPPARRRPVRTFLAPFDKAAAGTALMREKRRNGQSFVVVPRVEDIDDVLAMLKEIAPTHSVEVAHGKLSPEEVDEAMVRFADGGRDILVATTLIENGLDVPRANTMLIWGADRFGLAQLHQLRGRVGRGRVQGTAYLFAPDDEGVAERTRDRLAALIAADRLGAGFELSTRDLDIRGGGDLVGEEQAGHMKLIGASLYQHLLGRAVRLRKGEEANDRRAPTLQLAGDAALPDDYVPDVALRLELYTRLAHMEDVEAVEAFGEELEDRFGELPAETLRLLARRRVAILGQDAGVTAVVVGPKGAALTFTRDAAAAAKARMKSPRWKKDRLVLDVKSADPDKNLASLEALLLRLAPVKQRAEAEAA